eukprot:jgi/Mesvir1/9235/Mv03714-RA.1
MNASPDILQAFKAFLEEQQHAKMDPDRTEADENVLNRIYDQIVKPTTVMEARGSLQKANPFSDRQTYVVQERDTWSSIAARFNTMPEELIIANPHVSPRTLSAGGRGRRGEAGDGTVKGAIDAKASGLFQSFLNKVGQYGTIGKAASTAMGGMAKLGAYAPAAAQVGMGIKQLGQGGVSSLMAVPMIASGLYGGYKTYKHGPSLTDTVMSAMPIAGSALGPAAFALTSAAKTAMDSGLAARYDPASKWQTAKNMASNVRLAPMAAALASQYAVPYLASGMSANAEALARTAPIAASGLYEYARGRSSPKELLSLYAALMAGAHGPGMRPSDFGVQTAVSNAWENTSGIPRRAWDYTTGLPRRALEGVGEGVDRAYYEAYKAMFGDTTPVDPLTQERIYPWFARLLEHAKIMAMNGVDPLTLGTITKKTVNAAKTGVDPTTDTAFPFSPYIWDFGRALIDYVELTIGGYQIERITGDMLHVWDRLARPDNKSWVDNLSVHHGQSVKFDEKGNVIAYTDGKSKQYVYIPLDFTFTQDPGLSLPMIAMQYHEVRVKVKFQTADKMFAKNRHIGKGAVSTDAVTNINYEARPIVRRMLQEGKWGSALTQIVHTMGDRKIIDWLIANVEYSDQVIITNSSGTITINIPNTTTSSTSTFVTDLGSAYSAFAGTAMIVGAANDHIYQRWAPIIIDNNYATYGLEV